jgi:hypothetical protein
MVMLRCLAYKGRKIMPARNLRRKKNLSAHQKQMRFFTRMAMFIGLVFALGILWLINRENFFTR